MIDQLRVDLTGLLKDEILIEERDLFFLLRHGWNVGHISMFQHVVIEYFEVANPWKIQTRQFSRGLKSILFHTLYKVGELYKIFLEFFVDGFLKHANG